MRTFLSNAFILFALFAGANTSPLSDTTGRNTKKGPQKIFLTHFPSSQYVRDKSSLRNPT
jgi:hypothetical protein